MKHLYIVSYYYTEADNRTQGWGNSEVKLDLMLSTGDTRKIEKAIEKDGNFKKVTITSIFYTGEVNE